MNDYFSTKHLIPKENLYEIKFEEFEEDNLLHLKEIYDQFGMETWNTALPHFEAYVNAQKHYKKNKYTISKTELDVLKKEWGFAMRQLDYEIPENLVVLK